MKCRGMIAALLLCLPLTACARNARFDYSELKLRLAEADGAFAFDETDLFFADGTYYAFYAVDGATGRMTAREEEKGQMTVTEGEAGMLLTMREDGTGLLDRVTLTLDADARDAAPTFVAFAEAIARVFIPGADMDALREKTGLPDADTTDFDGLFAGTPGRYETGFYRASLIPGNEGVVFVVEYV